MQLIGLIGQARVGKDTVAAHLYRKYDFEQTSFAFPMKEMLATVFGDRFRHGDREAPIDWLGKSPRHLMQTLGTEWGRNCVHPELWVLLAEREVIKARERHYGLVITDVRFHNEADMILRNGGVLWRITRDSAEQINAHVSETADWSGHPHVHIPNNGTLDELYARVDRLMESSCVPC
jgi:hypothetical protein